MLLTRGCHQCCYQMWFTMPKLSGATCCIPQFDGFQFLLVPYTRSVNIRGQMRLISMMSIIQENLTRHNILCWTWSFHFNLLRWFPQHKAGECNSENLGPEIVPWLERAIVEHDLLHWQSAEQYEILWNTLWQCNITMEHHHAMSGKTHFYVELPRNTSNNFKISQDIAVIKTLCQSMTLVNSTSRFMDHGWSRIMMTIPKNDEKTDRISKMSSTKGLRRSSITFFTVPISLLGVPNAAGRLACCKSFCKSMQISSKYPSKCES